MTCERRTEVWMSLGLGLVARSEDHEKYWDRVVWQYVPRRFEEQLRNRLVDSCARWDVNTRAVWLIHKRWMWRIIWWRPNEPRTRTGGWQKYEIHKYDSDKYLCRANIFRIHHYFWTNSNEMSSTSTFSSCQDQMQIPACMRLHAREWSRLVRASRRARVCVKICCWERGIVREELHDPLLGWSLIRHKNLLVHGFVGRSCLVLSWQYAEVRRLGWIVMFDRIDIETKVLVLSSQFVMREKSIWMRWWIRWCIYW